MGDILEICSKICFMGRVALAAQYRRFPSAKLSDERRDNLHADVNVSFDDAAFGCEKLIHLTSQDGTGKRISLQVHVPAGIDDGQSIRLKGKGYAGRWRRRSRRSVPESSCRRKTWI